jgi:hypothetical protein
MRDQQRADHKSGSPLRQAIVRFSAAGCVAAWIALSSLAQEPPPPPMDDPPREALPQDDVEVLTRGPVHEAFAEPLASDPEPGLVVPRKPPEDIAEVAPDFKPDGDDVVWIPGYWAWDDDRDNFLWVSGIWRKLPPGLRWVPGYWLDDDQDGDWQWVSGLWVPDQQEELVYRQPPPETLEAGPTTPPPNDSYFWVPGCWMWYDVGYRWRPGYWHPYQENWVWVPAHWVWTPSGCLFVAGYWDYRVSTRGQLFAPVYFRRSGWYATHYYSPWCVIESTPLLIHFWVRPRYSHYYFGDYYGPRYASFGISPWSHWHSSPGHWDPLLTHYNVHYRHHDHFDYAARMSQWHDHYDRHADDRPRHTFRDQQQFASTLGSRPSQYGQQALLGLTLAAAAKKSDLPVALKPVDQDLKRREFRDSKQLRDLTRERAKSEKFAKIDSNRRVGDDKKGSGKGGLVTDLKDKGPDRPKVDLPKADDAKSKDAAKTPDLKTPKTEDPGKSLVGQDAKGEGDKRPTHGGPLKLPKSTKTTSKLATEAPKTPPQVTAPMPIDRKDLPKVDRPKTGRGAGDKSVPDLKTKPLEPKPMPRGESPTVKPPKVEAPKVSPKVETPKVQPKVEPPKVQPKVEPPKVQPKVDPPKVQPRVDPPKPPKVDPPKRSDPPKRGDDDDKKPKRGSK